ncbi:hypothetical protein [Cryptosporangium minutisporangium]|uniref:Uncharacterized protein n=1 Tax=Cryptosporangium minutisporangium TaxID=113569 RepID=A0ABP6SQG9_9ACTN
MDIVLAIVISASVGGVSAYRLFRLGLTLGVRQAQQELAAVQAAVETAHRMRELEAAASIELARRLPPPTGP